MIAINKESKPTDNESKYENSIDRHVAFIEGALDMDISQCYGGSGVASLFFPSDSDPNGWQDDFIEYDTMKGLHEFVSTVSLLIRLGRAQRRGK